MSKNKNKNKKKCNHAEGYVDTFVLRQRISTKAYNFYVKEYEHQYRDKRTNITYLTKIKSRYNRYISLDKLKIGIYFKQALIQKTESGVPDIYNYMYIRITSIPLLLEGKQSIKLYGDEDKDRIKAKLNELLRSNEYMRQVNDYQVHRIDYAYQIRYKSEKQVECLLNILHKTDKLRIGNWRGDYVTSLYEKNKSTVYNFYDKCDELKAKRKLELKKHGKYITPLYLVEEAEKTFRYEVQNKAIGNLVQMAALQEMNLNKTYEDLFSNEVAKIVLNNKLKQILKSEHDFYNKDGAIEQYLQYRQKAGLRVNEKIIKTIEDNGSSKKNNQLKIKPNLKKQMKLSEVHHIIIENRFRIEHLHNPISILDGTANVSNGRKKNKKLKIEKKYVIEF